MYEPIEAVYTQITILEDEEKTARGIDMQNKTINKTKQKRACFGWSRISDGETLAAWKLGVLVYRTEQRSGGCASRWVRS